MKNSRANLEDKAPPAPPSKARKPDVAAMKRAIDEWQPTEQALALLVQEMRANITEALKRGATYWVLCEIMKSHGVSITPESLRRLHERRGGRGRLAARRTIDAAAAAADSFQGDPAAPIGGGDSTAPAAP